jgi:hypothetical protein
VLYVYLAIETLNEDEAGRHELKRRKDCLSNSAGPDFTNNLLKIATISAIRVQQ